MVEILRGIAIASYRRRIILGPLAEGDLLATQALESTKYPAGLQLPLARNLIGAMRSAERFGAMQDDRAMTDAVKNGTFNGAIHPISPITGLCAASAIAGTDKPNTAVPVCLSVANQAASMDAFEWVGEALQLGAGCAGLAALHCVIAAADAAVTAGDLAGAGSLLADAKTLALRRDVLQPRLEAYGAYVAARIATRGGPEVTGNISDALPWGESLSQMLAFATDNKLRKRNLISMPRLYQLQRLRLSLGRNLKGQSADGLLEFYSKPPAIDVWRRDPVDAIAGTMADRTSLRLSRLRTAAARESGVDVFARIEDLQTGKIANQLAIGGRVLQSHAIARLPDELLDKQAVAFRNVAPKVIRDFRSAVKAAAAERPVAGADPNLQSAKLNQLERAAWLIALDRHDLPTVMPRGLDERQPTNAIPNGVAVLTFYLDNGMFHVVLATKQKSTYWSIRTATRVNGEIAKLPRAAGDCRRMIPIAKLRLHCATA